MKKCRMREIKWCVQFGSGRFRMEANFPRSSLQPDFFCTKAERAEKVLETICSFFFFSCSLSCFLMQNASTHLGGEGMGGAIGNAETSLPCGWQKLEFSLFLFPRLPMFPGKCCPRKLWGDSGF